LGLQLRQTASASKRSLALILAVVAGLALYAVLLHQTYTWPGNTHPDFFVEWTASRVALSGGNPYGAETTAAIQIGSKGHLVAATEDQLAFVYPLYAALVNAPLVLLPYDWATAIRQSVTQIALLAGVLLFIRSIRWRASPGELGLALLITILAYPTFGGVMLGQMAVAVLALLLFTFWALRQGHDVLAGGCLALSTVKPQLVILVVPGLLLWSLVQRRWSVLVAFAIVLGLLTVVSLLIFPAWPQELLQAILRYPSYKSTRTGPGFLLIDCCGSASAWLLQVAAIGGLAAGWWLARDGNARWTEGAFVLTLAMTCFLPPQTSPVDRMLLLPAVLLLMRDAPNWPTKILIALVSVVGPWLAYALLYETHYGLNMALPSLVVLLALGVWYIVGIRRYGTRQQAKQQAA
jgi:hypothetical protein